MDKMRSKKTAKTAKKVHRKLCSMPHCQSATDDVVNGQRISFHEIPADLKLREIFLQFIDRKDKEGNPWIPNQRALLCSRHFEPPCFKDLANGSRRLLPGSIPTIFPDGHPKAPKRVRRKPDVPMHKKAATVKEQNVQEKAQVIHKPVETWPNRKRNIAETQVPFEEVDLPLQVFSESEDEGGVSISKRIKLEPTEPAHSLEELCRLCSEPCTNNCVNVFAHRMKTVRLSFMINFCLPVQVKTTDVLPLNICIPCEEKVEEYYKFALQCKSTEKMMMEMCSAQNPLQQPSSEEPGTTSHSPGGPTSVPEGPQSLLGNTDSTTFESSFEFVKMERVLESTPKPKATSTYTCKYCYGVFYHKKRRDLHMRTLHGAEMSEERKKKRILAKEESMKINKAAKEGKIKLLRKAKDPKVRKIRVQNRKPYVNVRTPCICDLCGKTYCSKESLKIHIKRHNPEKNFICHICGLRFHFTGELKLHHTTHERKTIWCDICNTKFGRKNTLAQHMVDFHLERYRYICKECNDFFRSKREAKEHVKQHGENAVFVKCYLHRCPTCKINCHTKYEKQLHFQREHKDVRLKIKPITFGHYCKLCFKMFRSGVNFQAHYKKQHPDLPVPVEPQPRNNLTSSLLPYLYNCEFCSKKFKFSDTFSKHMKKYHKTDIVG